MRVTHRTPGLRSFSPASAGESLSEYALLLGLVALLAIPGTLYLSSAMGITFQQAAPTQARAGELMGLLGDDKTAKTAQAAAPEKLPTFDELARYYPPSILEIVPSGGQSSPTSGDGTTTTGAEGVTVDTGTSHAFSSLRLSGSLEEMAARETDPAMKAYLNTLARKTYYLGLAEGELDDINGLDIRSGYNNASALQDVVRLSKQLKALLAAPPKGGAPEARTLASVIGTEVYNVAQQYTTHFAEFINPNGTVTRNWGNRDLCANSQCMSNGYPGMALNSAKNTDYRGGNGATYAIDSGKHGNFNALRAQANQVLQANQVTSAPVKLTLSDARFTDTAAERPDMWQDERVERKRRNKALQRRIH